MLVYLPGTPCHRVAQGACSDSGLLALPAAASPLALALPNGCGNGDIISTLPTLCLLCSPVCSSSQPEFLFSEEALVHKRSWSENLTYYTGMGYLAGGRAGPIA